VAPFIVQEQAVGLPVLVFVKVAVLPEIDAVKLAVGIQGGGIVKVRQQ
jgi:hypothetical protein